MKTDAITFFKLSLKHRVKEYNIIKIYVKKNLHLFNGLPKKIARSAMYGMYRLN